jgi:hypothetical protein
MTEELEQTEDEQGRSLWDILDLEDPDKDTGEEQQDDMDEEIAREDKLERKMSAKMENMQKKFETTMLRERIGKFESEADELEVDMFRTVASDVKSLEDFDKAMGIVRKQSASLRASAEKYREKLEEEAQQATARAWGTGPVGTPQKRSPDMDKERDERIKGGDNKAALEALMDGDVFGSNIF